MLNLQASLVYLFYDLGLCIAYHSFAVFGLLVYLKQLVVAHLLYVISLLLLRLLLLHLCFRCVACPLRSDIAFLEAWATGAATSFIPSLNVFPNSSRLFLAYFLSSMACFCSHTQRLNSCCLSNFHFSRSVCSFVTSMLGSLDANPASFILLISCMP